MVFYRLISSCLDQFTSSLHQLDQAQLVVRISLLENISSKSVLLRLLDFKSFVCDRYLGAQPLFTLILPILKEISALDILLQVFDERFLSLYVSFHLIFH